jgi:hypothetical protein
MQVDDKVCGTGVSSLRMNGAIHHRMGPLLPKDGSGDAQFAQIYVLDNAEDRLNRRSAIMPTLRRDILSRLSEELEEHNVFARTLLAASVKLAHMDAAMDLMVTIKGTSKGRGVDSRRTNAPTATEVAAWIPDGSDPVKGCKDIKLFARSGETRHISSMHPSYMALHFPLLFPYGESGWHTEIQHRSGMSTAADDEEVEDILRGPATSRLLFEGLEAPPELGGPNTDGRKRCTLQQFANYHFHRRPTLNLAILHGGR